MISKRVTEGQKGHWRSKGSLKIKRLSWHMIWSLPPLLAERCWSIPSCNCDTLPGRWSQTRGRTSWRSRTSGARTRRSSGNGGTLNDLCTRIGKFVRGDAANSWLDALFDKTKLGQRNCFIFWYVLGILIDYTRTKFQHPSSSELR
jgi:hypothetical protein